MTAEEKKNIAFFIDLASGWARGGYLREEREYRFSDDHDSSDRSKGAPEPLVMVIGDVSDLGEEALLLDKMLGAIGLSRESNCFITNVIEYEGRLQSMKPRFILCLGESASQALLHSGIEKLRGRLMDFKTKDMTIPLIATYHPGDLLRNGNLKRPCWDDLKLLRASIAPAAGGAQIVHGVKPC
jgi:DNA polymerase